MPYHLHDHLKLHHLHFTEVNELYISLSLRAFSLGLIGIFVPIYLYVLGLPFVTIASFFMLTFAVRVFVHPLAAWLSTRFGPKHVIVLSYVLIFCYVMLLYILPEALWLLFPAAVVAGFADSFFWIARHIDWATVAFDRQPSGQLSLLLIFSNIAMTLAPLIGGLAASIFGINYTLLGAGAGLLVAIYPLFKTLEPAVPHKTHLKLLRVAPRRHLVANFARNFENVVSVLFWPLFIYLIVMTYEGVGLIASASLFLLVIIGVFLGKLGDKGKNTQILKTGAKLRTVLHLARVPVQSFPAAMAVNIVGDITDLIAGTPYAVRFYEGARRYGITAYLVDVEIAGDFAKMTAWAVLLVLYLAFGLNLALIATFVLAATVMPLLRLIEPVEPRRVKVAS